MRNTTQNIINFKNNINKEEIKYAMQYIGKYEDEYIVDVNLRYKDVDYNYIMNIITLNEKPKITNIISRVENGTREDINNAIYILEVIEDKIIEGIKEYINYI